MLERVVLDTNVLVSAVLKPDSYPSRLLNLILSGKIIMAYDSRIYSEYKAVLERPKFSFPKHDIQTLLSFIRLEGESVAPLPMDVQLPDPKDLPFIEVAAASNAAIVTGNPRHFSVEGIRVVTPRDAVANWHRCGRLETLDMIHDGTSSVP